MKTALSLFALLSLIVPAAAAEAGGKTPKARSPMGADEVPGKPHIYKESAGKPRQMEIYFPPNHDPATAKVPGLILFHGGGWGGGTLGQFRKACAYFASRGLVCATAEYQMLGKDEAKKLPEGETRKRVCITDAKSAIRWFKQQAPELGIDPDRIITGGGSAGGHISVLATLNPGLNDPADPKDIDTRVVAYLLFNPAFATNDDQDPEIDVLRHLKADMAPAIVFFGDKDNWKKGWDTAHAKLNEMGNTTIDEQIATGQGHSFFNNDPWQTVTLLAADRFLIGQGLLSGEPTLSPPPAGETLVAADAGFVSLFNGRDLDGWDGDPALWKVEDGLVVGTCAGPDEMTHNSFLIWRGGTVKDFELRATVRVVGDNNSGIQYRSRELPEVGPFVISGYQCDIHPAIEHTGMTYEEKGRGIFGLNGTNVMLDPGGSLWKLSGHEPVKADVSEWNEYTIIARGNHLVHKINGQVSSELIDHHEAGRAMEGLLAIQLHQGNPNSVQIKELKIKTLDDGELLPFNPADLPAGATKISKPRTRNPQGTGPVLKPKTKTK